MVNFFTVKIKNNTGCEIERFRAEIGTFYDSLPSAYESRCGDFKNIT